MILFIVIGVPILLHCMYSMYYLLAILITNSTKMAQIRIFLKKHPNKIEHEGAMIIMPVFHSYN